MKNNTRIREEKNSSLRVVISGGGTGGHIYPALAIAQGLKEAAGADILYMGCPSSMESRLAAQAGLKFAPVEARALRGKSLKTLMALASNWRGAGQAKKLLKAYKPHLIIGTGGYGAAPVLFAGGGLGIPIIIHEQNAYPGLANRFLSRYADLVLLTFADAKEYFPKKTKFALTGLPVRKSIMEADKSQALEKLGLSPLKPVLLAAGGSQGSKSINSAVVGALPGLLEAGLQIILVCGEKNYTQINKDLKDKGILDQNGIVLVSYSDDMEILLAAADLALARAGASFIAELLIRGLPAILIPYPFAAANHQELNAQSLERAGAAILIKDNELSPQTLIKAVLPLIEDRKSLAKMAACSAGLAKPKALEDIISLALELAGR